jgi:hypothetical protein
MSDFIERWDRMSQSGKSGHDTTTTGWDEGKYARDERKREERRRIITVAIIALFFVCTFVCVAVGAYMYI